MFGAVSGAAVVKLAEAHWFYGLESLTGINRYSLAMWAWLLANAAWGIWYFVLVARGTVGARYANR